MTKVKVSGICVECGCTENNPCFHTEEGTCWWTDETETLCSHCDDPEIRNSPVTKHCINTAGKYFCRKTTNYPVKTSIEKDLNDLSDNITNSIIDDHDTFKFYLLNRLGVLNKNNNKCNPAYIGDWTQSPCGEIKCVLASANYKIHIHLYPMKRIL